MGEGRRFHLVECLGEGAHGEVYLAEQESSAGFRRKVALKVLRAELGNADEAARRMRDEARILGRLAHRNIVTVSDLVRLQDRWAVVMDYLPGADLDRVICALETAGQHFPPRAAVAVAAGICSALHAAWSVDNGSGSPLRLVHRDIKPSNVLLSAEGDVKVLDFGVARVDLDTREAATGLFRVGTERYMAPERLLGEGDSPAGDVYATMATLVEMLLREPLGRTPIVDTRHDAFLDRIMERVAARIGESKHTAALCDAIRQGLACEPVDRPSAGELAERLGGLVEKVPGSALIPFARAFVPRVGSLVGVQGKPASGTLLEATSGPETAVLWADPPTLEAVPARRQPARWAAVAIVAALVVGCTGAGTALALSDGWAVGAPVPAESALTQPQAALANAPTGVADDAQLDVVIDEAGTPAPERVAPERIAPERIAPIALATDGPDATAQVEPARGTPPARTPEPEPAPGTADDTPVQRVSAAFFVLPDASALTVRCGDVERTGTASVRLRDLPAGVCTMTATYLGETLSTDITVNGRREVQCAVSGGVLRCR